MQHVVHLRRHILADCTLQYMCIWQQLQHWLSETLVRNANVRDQFVCHECSILE